MKNLVKFLIAFFLVVAAGTVFVTRGLDDNVRRPRFLEHFTALSRQRIEATGKIAEERRPLGDFTRIELTGSGSVELVLGEENAVSVRADESALPRAETIVRDGVLTLGMAPGVSFAGSPVRYAVTAKRVVEVKTSGSGDVSVKSSLVADELALRSEGSGDIAATVTAKKLNVTIAGSGDVDLGGNSTELSIAILGSGSVNARNLSGRSANVNVAGSGDVELGSFETIEANVAGSGDVVYDGSPRVTSRILGSGKLRSR